jgi:hypothetical protein
MDILNKPSKPNDKIIVNLYLSNLSRQTIYQPTTNSRPRRHLSAKGKHFPLGGLPFDQVFKRVTFAKTIIKLLFAIGDFYQARKGAYHSPQSLDWPEPIIDVYLITNYLIQTDFLHFLF